MVIEALREIHYREQRPALTPARIRAPHGRGPLAPPPLAPAFHILPTPPEHAALPERRR